MIVVIDGPAGAGKSTAARELARRLGCDYLDTGAMYRACTLRALRLGLDLAGDSEPLVRVVREAELDLRPSDDGSPTRVLLDGQDVSEEIRTREVTGAIHHLAGCAPVREVLVERQRELASRAGSVVAEGRDLASVVFPDAPVKIYLDASTAVRARRRARDLGDDAPPLEALECEIAERDQRDQTRDASPLVRVPDAVLVDTSDLTFEEVVERLVEVARSAEA
jgi:cytidylate kinase